MGCHDVLLNGGGGRGGRGLENIWHSFLSEPLLSGAYVNVLKIKYWLARITAFFAFTANITKTKLPPNIRGLR